MAISKELFAQQVTSVVANIGHNLSDSAINEFQLYGCAQINGNVFKIANPWSEYKTYRVKVNTSWFEDEKNFSKPTYKPKGGKRVEVDYQLIPSIDDIFILNNSDLKNYCLALETNVEKWANESTWGMTIYPERSSFSWIDSKKEFKLDRLSSVFDSNFHLLENTVASDLDEPVAAARIETRVMRIVRDTKIIVKLKHLYENKCQICGVSVQIAGGKSYSEGHHIQPLGGGHDGPDCEENIIILCPNHHAQLDFLGVELELDKISFRGAHRIGEQYVRYHNEKLKNPA